MGLTGSKDVKEAGASVVEDFVQVEKVIEKGFKGSKNQKRAYIAVSIAMVALAGVAAYFAISYGLSFLNAGNPVLGGLLLFAGGTYVISGGTNAWRAVNKLFLKKDEHVEYTGKDAILHSTMSLLAPVTGILYAFHLGKNLLCKSDAATEKKA